MVRKVDWLQILQENGIPYVDRGPNVKRGHINIQCPLCGSADPSKHMGLDLETSWWACWRNKDHRGKSPLRLFTRLLKIPYWKARQMLGLDEAYVDPDGYDAVAARIMGRNENIERMEQVRREFLDFPEEFEEIWPSGTTRRFFDYLADGRSFGEAGVRALSKEYDLCCAKRGDYVGRVVIPYFVERELVAWTARAISPATIRYKDLGLEDCLIPIKETLFNHDAIITGGKWLITVEGPIDALKLDLFGKPYGVRAVAMSTNSLSEDQVYLLQAAADNFEHMGVMLDNATSLGLIDSFKLKQELAQIPNLTSLPVPFGAKDGGALLPKEVREWASDLVN